LYFGCFSEGEIPGVTRTPVIGLRNGDSLGVRRTTGGRGPAHAIASLYGLAACLYKAIDLEFD
jgi:hypothetical protein